MLYFTAVSGAASWVTGILTQCSQLHKESIDLSKIQEYLNIPEPFRFEGGVQPPAADGYELRLENVSFHYPGTERDILRHIDLTIHPGEKLAVVGLNGAGKTTMVMLLCGFYDPTEGRVLLKLIDRETDYTAYEVLREFRGGFVAGFWQGISRIFGQNLKSQYDKDNEDKMIEQIVIYYEAGLLR